MRYPFVKQHDEKDCGAACLAMICSYYGLKLPLAKFRALIRVDSQGANIYGIVAAADALNMRADALEGTEEELLDGIQTGEIHFPLIARIITEQQFEHFIVVYRLDRKKVVIGDPGKCGCVTISYSQFQKQWLGQIITILPGDKFSPKDELGHPFLHFFRFVEKERKWLGIVMCLSLLISAVNVSGALLFQYILNGSIQTDLMTLNALLADFRVVCVVLAAMYLLRCVMQILRNWMLALITRNVDIQITNAYFEKLTVLPPQFYESRKTGEFLSRFYDISRIRDTLSNTVLTVVLDSVMAIACGVLLWRINDVMFGITVLILLMYTLILCCFKRPILTVNHRQMEQEAQVTSYFKEVIDGMETVKANQYEPVVQGRFENMYRLFSISNQKGSMIYGTQDALITLSTSIGILLLLGVGVHLNYKGVIGIADVFVFYYLIGYFLEPVSNLINLQPEIRTAAIAAERLNDILDAETEQVIQTRKDEKIFDIAVQNIDFRYGFRSLVLHSVCMHFSPGKRIAIVGESGCGKTTLAKLLLGFHAPESGKICVNGEDMQTQSISWIRSRVAYISQNIFLFSDTVFRNLTYGNPDLTLDMVKDVCRKCRADDFIESLPMQYDTMLEENGSNLSVGQRQRLAIARALLMQPDVFILDEATSNLDVITEEGIRETIKELSSDKICIVIAHRLRTIRDCDWIYVMEGGRIVEQGTHEMLCRTEGLYQAYVSE